MLGAPLAILDALAAAGVQLPQRILRGRGDGGVGGDWAPHGVVPDEHFDAAYREHDDGKGYTFEYRIFWATLGAENDHPVSGDVVNATVQFLWSDSTGLNLAKGGVTYDIMSQPGFPWQTADGTGGWGGDYGPPTAACVAGDTVVLGWTGHEAGWGIIGVDLDGQKKWGAKQKNTAHLATDGKALVE